MLYREERVQTERENESVLGKKCFKEEGSDSGGLSPVPFLGLGQVFSAGPWPLLAEDRK